MGAGAVSVYVLDAVPSFPRRARFFPKAVIRVVPPETVIAPVPLTAPCV
jgi:hypothetical protein